MWIRVTDTFRHELAASVAHRDDVFVYAAPDEEATYFSFPSAAYLTRVAVWLDRVGVTYETVQGPPPRN